MKRLNVEFTPAIRRLDIQTHGAVNTQVIGKYKSVFRGKGLEFESYREYVPGLDDASLIDWKASLRAGKELVKEYTEERNLNVFFLIDTSSSMMLGSDRLLKNEYTANVAASISFAVLQAGDNVGFGLFSDKVFLFRKPAGDLKQYYVLAETLILPKNYGGKCNIGAALKFVEGFLPKRSVLIVLSDFIGADKGWERSLAVAGKIFDLVGIMIRDPVDDELPESRQKVVLEDSFSGSQIVVEPHRIKDAYKREAERFKLYIKNQFLRAGGDVVVLKTNMPYIAPIRTFFKRRSTRFR